MMDNIVELESHIKKTLEIGWSDAVYDGNELDVDVPLQAAFFALSPFSESGLISSSLVKIKDGFIYVYAPQKMSLISGRDEFYVALGLPVHQGEMEHEVSSLLNFLKVSFDGFIFSSRDARFAKLKVLSIKEDDGRVLFSSLLRQRHEVYAINPIKSAMD